MLRFKITTVFGGNTHEFLAPPSTRTLREAINVAYQYFWQEYDTDLLATKTSLDIKLVSVND